MPDPMRDPDQPQGLTWENLPPAATVSATPPPPEPFDPQQPMTHPLSFEMPSCARHFFKGHRWWCRACDRTTEIEMRDARSRLVEGARRRASDRLVSGAASDRKTERRIARRMWFLEWGEIVIVYGTIAVIAAIFVVTWLATR